jgi:hypothetical protein
MTLVLCNGPVESGSRAVLALVLAAGPCERLRAAGRLLPGPAEAFLGQHAGRPGHRAWLQHWPGDERHVGLAAAHGVHVLNTLRDPLEVLLAAHARALGRAAGTPADLRAYFFTGGGRQRLAAYLRMMRDWAQAPAPRVHTVRHAGLEQAFETEVRALLAFLGMAPEPARLARARAAFERLRARSAAARGPGAARSQPAIDAEVLGEVRALAGQSGLAEAAAVPQARPPAPALPAPADFVITGFPKCGTSALARGLERLEGVRLDRDGGQLESPFFADDAGVARLRALAPGEPGDGRIRGHKFTAYVYNPAALRRAAALCPQAVFIACIRDPLRALLSWREMHRRIAAENRLPRHPVNASEESRAFYQGASIEDYYHRFARPRLAYTRHLQRLVSLVGPAPLVVVSQEYLAAREGWALAAVGGVLGTRLPADHPQSPPHRSLAERADALAVPADLRRELDDEHRRLLAFVRALPAARRHTLVLVDDAAAPLTRPAA